MRNCWKWLLTLGVAAIASTAIVFIRRNSEPRYGGKPLSEWVLASSADLMSAESGENIDHALRQIGTNGIPYFLKWISDETTPSRFENRVDAAAAWLNEKLQTNFEPRARLRKHLKLPSVYAIEALGENAAFAVPGLGQILEGTNGSDPKFSAAEVLGRLGPIGLPTLARALTNSNPAVRGAAVFGLRFSGTNAEPFIPKLVKLLDDDPKVQRSAFVCLSYLQLRSDIVIPEMITRLESGNSSEVDGAAHVLRAYGPIARQALPALQAAREKAKASGDEKIYNVLFSSMIDIDPNTKATPPKTNAPAVDPP